MRPLHACDSFLLDSTGRRRRHNGSTGLTKLGDVRGGDDGDIVSVLPAQLGLDVLHIATEEPINCDRTLG